MKIKDNEPEVTWDSALTFEAWMRLMLSQGYTEIVVSVLKLLPEERKAYYREIYKEVKDKDERLAHSNA